MQDLFEDGKKLRKYGTYTIQYGLPITDSLYKPGRELGEEVAIESAHNIIASSNIWKQET